jgi:ubiquinone biosynthesis protein
MQRQEVQSNISGVEASMKTGTIKRLGENTRRVREIIGTFAKYGLAGWFKGWHPSWVADQLKAPDGRRISEIRVEERVRLIFTELGPTFIKLGQMLSTRPDFVGAEMARELAHLQTSVAADPPDMVRNMIAAELGQPPDNIFSQFEEMPFASGSIAQVHHARLQSGEDVVVKVQHSGISKKILPDLDILANLAELAEKHAPQLRPYQPRAIIRQFSRVLLRELDFSYERVNLEEFAKHFADDPTVHFPVSYKALSTRRVLTMERLDGILGADSAALKAHIANSDEFTWRCANMYMEMILRDKFYHADPHPGNLMLLPGGIVGVLDVGKIGRLDEELTEGVESILIAIVNHNASELAELLLRFGSAPPGVPRDQLRGDLTAFIADYANQSIVELDLGSALSRLLEIIRSYHITLTPEFSLLFHTLIELEGTLQQLSPKFSLAEVVQPYYSSIVQRRLSPKRIFTNLRRTYSDWERLVGTLPRDVGSLFQRIRDGSFTVYLEHRHLDPIVNRLVLGVLTAALFVGSSMLWSANAPPRYAEVSIFGCAGYLLAVLIGWRLLRAIRKSGDISSEEHP